MSKSYIPVEYETREELYVVKRGFTWDVLLLQMLRAYKAKQKAERACKGCRQRGGVGGEKKTLRARQRGGKRGEKRQA